MDCLSTTGATTAGRPSGESARDDGSNVISLSEYRHRRFGSWDDDPPRPTPQAARAVRLSNQHGCSAVAGRPSEFAIS
jgi:hypothetical protein